MQYLLNIDDVFILLIIQFLLRLIPTGCTYQFSYAAILPDYPACPAEPGHVSDRLCSQGLQLLDRRVQNGHDALQAPHVNDGLADLHVVTNLPQDFERADLKDAQMNS